jgi:hypothetical protein
MADKRVAMRSASARKFDQPASRARPQPPDDTVKQPFCSTKLSLSPYLAFARYWRLALLRLVTTRLTTTPLPRHNTHTHTLLNTLPYPLGPAKHRLPLTTPASYHHASQAEQED